MIFIKLGRGRPRPQQQFTKGDAYSIFGKRLRQPTDERCCGRGRPRSL